MMAKHSKLRIGMVGGGPGAGVAPTHRLAIRLDGRYDLVAGAFSRDPALSRQAGEEFGVAPDRIYDNASDMARAEAARPDGIDVVSIVTQNDTHYSIAKTFLENGIPVICDKPLAVELPHAEDLGAICRSRGLFVALMHNYSAYGMVRHAARLLRDGKLGTIRMVQVEHASGWGTHAVEESGRKQAKWRTDPKIGGAASVVYDLGTHAHHLMRFITGLEVSELSAEMYTAVPGRRVYDNAFVNLRLANGSRGALWASMAATGHEHGLRIRVYGADASLEWWHDDFQHLTIRYAGGRKEILAMGQPGLSADSEAVRRISMGHPEGFIESMANVYREVADRLEKKAPIAGVSLSFPDERDGVEGLRFVEAVVRSHEDCGRWTAVVVP